MPAPLLEACAVTVGDPPRLASFDLAVEEGETVAITGPSGAGKTTALRALAGLVSLAAGELRLRGRAPELDGWPSYRRQVHLLLQTPVMLPGTVRENLEAAFAPAAATSTFDPGRAAELLAELGLEARLDDPAADLSVGEAQRVHLVRSLLVEPAVLLLDEPTSALDAGNQRRVEALLEARGGATVLVSHDEEQLARMGARTVALPDRVAS
jgi:ABC-type iron transport system FetAB ATPase subunit